MNSKSAGYPRFRLCTPNPPDFFFLGCSLTKKNPADPHASMLADWFFSRLGRKKTSGSDPLVFLHPSGKTQRIHRTHPKFGIGILTSYMHIPSPGIQINLKEEQTSLQPRLHLKTTARCPLTTNIRLKGDRERNWVMVGMREESSTKLEVRERARLSEVLWFSGWQSNGIFTKSFSYSSIYSALSYYHVISVSYDSL